jgi:hypothetical protein
MIASSLGLRPLSESPVARPPLDVQDVRSQRNLPDYVRSGVQEIIL